MSGWQKVAFFYSVPPVAQDSRFFNEVVETGDMLWRDWRTIRVETRHEKRWKTMSWQPFTLANTKLRMEMRIEWSESKGVSTQPRLEVIMTPLESLKGNFNMMLAFAMWNPDDVGKFVSKYKYVPKYTVKPRHPVSFEDAVELQKGPASLPVTDIFDMSTRCNTALYVRLELQSPSIYPATGPNAKNRALADGPGVVYQMENQNHDTQDSTIFDYEGARWRLFFQKKPTVMLLLQRMPMDDPRTEIGAIEVEFDLLGVRKNGEYVKNSLTHTFEPGFNDWGEASSNYKKAEWFVVRLNALHVDRQGPAHSINRINGSQTQEISPFSAQPPPGPPPGHSDNYNHAGGPPVGLDQTQAGVRNEPLPEYSLQ